MAPNASTSFVLILLSCRTFSMLKDKGLRQKWKHFKFNFNFGIKSELIEFFLTITKDGKASDIIFKNRITFSMLLVFLISHPSKSKTLTS